MNKVLLIFLFSVSFGFTKLGFSQLFDDQAIELQISHSMSNTDYWGAGVSVFDIDNDGWDDITFIQENDSIVIYKNNAGNFQKLQPFYLNQGRTKSQIWVDYDNDGDNDLFISNYNGRLKLLRNNGNFNFIEVPFEDGLSEINSANYGITFADYDRDGFLDMYLCRYVFTGDPTNEGLTNLLLRNDGDGTFSNVTSSAGVGNGIGLSFMGVWMDVNKDKWPDLYVINDRVGKDNTLYRNNGNGTFTDLTASSGTALPGDDPMSATFADFDNDGDLDHYSSNSGDMGKLGRLLVKGTGWNFTEQGQAYGVAIDKLSWGATWIDADNDSYLDLYVATGNGSGIVQEDRNYLYMNQIGLFFEDSPQHFSDNHIAGSFSVAKGDLNNDGFSDLVVQNVNGTNSFIWMNQSTLNGQNNFIKISLEGTVSNKMAIGTWINVHCGSEKFVHFTRCGENYLSQNSQHYIFGLGNHTTIDSVVIEYPSGITERFYNLLINQNYTFIEGQTFSNSIVYSGSLSFCLGDSVVLDAGDFESYSWSNGQTGRFISVSESGSYSVVVENEFGYLITSNAVNINVGVTPTIIPSVFHISCFGQNDGQVNLNLPFSTNYQVSWNSGGNGAQLNNLAAGIYTYEYQDIFGCSAIDSVQIFEPMPLMVFSENSYNQSSTDFNVQIEIVGGTPSYAVFIDGIEHFGNSFILPDGVYNLSIVDANNCSIQSSLVLSTAELESQLMSNVDFYPNPNSTGVYYFDMSNIKDLLIFDSYGKQVAVQLDLTNRFFTLNAAKGVYFVRVVLDGLTFNRKIILD
jgi:hypothetical protein